MALRLSHIVNVLEPPDSSDLVVAQPVTLESMVKAAEFARNQVDVELFAVKFADEQVEVPSQFDFLDNLQNSIYDIGELPRLRRLPLLRDVLYRAYEASAAEYIVYTNVDISLMPHFYLMVDTVLQRGIDGFVVNRRSITDRLTTKEELPIMYSMIGSSHPGFDCFVFRRKAFRNFILKNAFVGLSPIGKMLLINILCQAKRFATFTDLHCTFHLGVDRPTMAEAYRPHRDFNWQQFSQIISCLQERMELPEHQLVSDFQSRVRRWHEGHEDFDA